MTIRTLVRALLMAATPATAAAHDLSAQYGPFLGPAVHVLTEADHVAALLGVGLLAGRHPPRMRAAVLIASNAAFLLAMAAPLAFQALRAFESVEGIMSPASLLLAGALVALWRRLPASIAVPVALAIGSVHGLANGLAIEGGTHAAVSVLGGVGGAALIGSIGAATAAFLHGPRGRIVVQVLGSWVAAMGLMLLGLALR
jgi:urease accessory protein